MDDQSNASFVSIIVPVYNGESTIGNCLASTMKLEYPREKLEVIVIDDGSEDNTINIANRYPVKLIQKNHGGYPSAMNVGIRHAKGEIVLNIDSDTYISKNWLTKIITEFRNATVGIAGGYVATAPSSSFWAKLAGFESEDRTRKVKRKYVDFITSTCTAYRKKLFAEIGLFNEAMRRGSDEELAQRALKACWKIVFREDALSYHDWDSSFNGFFRKQVSNMVYEVKSVLWHPELLRGKEEHPPSLYIPLFLTFFFLLTPLWFFMGVVWASFLSLAALLIWHMPQTIRIIHKHKDRSMLFLPIAINVRYVAWLIGIAAGLVGVICARADS